MYIYIYIYISDLHQHPRKKIENIIKREGITDPDAPDDAASTRWWCSVGGKATSTEKVSLSMTASAAVATTPENLGSLLGDPGNGQATLALTNGSDIGGSGKGPSLEALVEIMKSGGPATGGGNPAPKAKGKAKAKAKASVTRDTSKPTDEQLADIRNKGPQLKSFFPLTGFTFHDFSLMTEFLNPLRNWYSCQLICTCIR